MPPQQIVRSVRNARHSTTVDMSVIGVMVQAVAAEIDGIYEAQLDKAELVAEGKTEDSDNSKQPEAVNRFDERADIVLHIKLTPYINEHIGPLVQTLRNRVIERIQQITDLKVHAVHIHVAGLWFR